LPIGSGGRSLLFGFFVCQFFVRSAGDKPAQILLAKSEQRNAMGQAALERALSILFFWDRIAGNLLEQMNNPHHDS
jgi:hypothetical protein